VSARARLAAPADWSGLSEVLLALEGDTRGGTKQKSLEPVMSQVCDICGKGPQFGNNISHAHNITRRRWSVNLQAVKALVNGVSKRIRVCTSCIKSGKITKSTKAVKA
jgi:large subunit ribosomal protein L28